MDHPGYKAYMGDSLSYLDVLLPVLVKIAFVILLRIGLSSQAESQESVKCSQRRQNVSFC